MLHKNEIIYVHDFIVMPLMTCWYMHHVCVEICIYVVFIFRHLHTHLSVYEIHDLATRKKFSTLYIVHVASADRIDKRGHDNRALNKITLNNQYPLLKIDDLLD